MPAARRELALAHLDVLIDLYDRGMREPLPLARRVLGRVCRSLGGRREPRRPQAARAWESGFEVDGRTGTPSIVLVFGGELPTQELFAEAPRPDEQGPGWAG